MHNNIYVCGVLVHYVRYYSAVLYSRGGTFNFLYGVQVLRVEFRKEKVKYAGSVDSTVRTVYSMFLVLHGISSTAFSIAYLYSTYRKMLSTRSTVLVLVRTV